MEFSRGLFPSGTTASNSPTSADAPNRPRRRYRPRRRSTATTTHAATTVTTVTSPTIAGRSPRPCSGNCSTSDPSRPAAPAPAGAASPPDDPLSAHTMEQLANPEIWNALATLTALELVLGIDNLIFISILAAKRPPETLTKARRIGLPRRQHNAPALLRFHAWKH